MATYKVIQDIEAEDKLLGPLSLRQFIYAVIVVLQIFVVFQLSKVSPFFYYSVFAHYDLFCVTGGSVGQGPTV